MQAWTLGLMSDVQVAALKSQLPSDLKLIPLTGKVPYAGTLTGDSVRRTTRSSTRPTTAGRSPCPGCGRIRT